MLKQLPNLCTIINLSLGFFSILLATSGNCLNAAIFILIASFFDFLDGFLAKKLNASSELGGQLDSLADLVTFGVAPAILIYQLLIDLPQIYSPYANYIVVLIPIFSALRLAKFNIDDYQQSNFLGLPTPANALFFVSIIIYMETSSFSVNDGFNPYGLIISFVILFSFLMISKISFFSLKFVNYKWEENKIRYLFLLGSIILTFVAIFMNLMSLNIAFIIFLYLILSLVNNIITKNEI
jgi:CDP-diacylglycerol--serine O-phosphatidyltransferase